MGTIYLSLFMHLLLVPSCFHVLVATDSSFPPMLPLCHPQERSALLRFQRSLAIDESASVDASAYPKVSSWKLESNCCTEWDGVECDESTGHVIGLDLSSSFLLGSINSSNALFSLLHLQSLNLADNNFNYSQIPSEIGRLSHLASLNLSQAWFSGQIPSGILKLSKLVSLDLSNNVDSSFLGLLKLKKPTFNSLLQNLTNLEELRLSQVDISSQVPKILSNLTSVTTLVLSDCGLHGKFSVGIFHLPKLRVLNVRDNQYLTGYLPEFLQSSHLEILRLASTGFSGKLPDSIGNLNFLNKLDFYNCNFSGSLPIFLDNLTLLTYLDLGDNKFSGDIPHLGGLSRLKSFSLSANNFNVGSLPWLSKLSEVIKLYLIDINLAGSIPSSIANLTHLTDLHLGLNHLNGKIPPQLTNLTQLIDLSLYQNQLTGQIPKSFSQLKNLFNFNANWNDLSGTIELDIFLELKSLTSLQLGANRMTVLTKITTNTTLLPKLLILGLNSCNLKEFPDFLRFQDKLEVLDLGANELHGKIPTWMLNTSKETLGILFLRDNLLTGFDQCSDLLPWDNLAMLNLKSNLLQGLLPIPPQPLLYYDVSHNRLTGEIPPLICQLSSLYFLDLSNNFLNGTVPPCLGNFSNSLSVLNLQSNNFHGPIPQEYNRENKLKMIDFSQNKLRGKMPRSLVNCSELEILNLSDNLIEDEFPFWLAVLVELQVLILRSNKFYGSIGGLGTNLEFPNLRVIDLSHNGFTGYLPTRYFDNWTAMKGFDMRGSTYLHAPVSFFVKDRSWDVNYSYPMTITNKGVKREYEKVLNIFTAIDFSGNKFKGELPESIGNLKGLQLLNLSNNDLSGGIPSDLGNLTNLESLDISQNRLSGEIPWQLAELTFLAFLNVSHNNLTGRIPTGKQFNTFLNNSYDGNSGLCGEPLSRKCGKAPPPPPPVNSRQGTNSAFPSTAVDWIVISMGYGSGIVVGVVIGQILTTRYHEWFIQTFGRKKQKHGKEQRSRRGNKSQ